MCSHTFRTAAVSMVMIFFIAAGAAICAQAQAKPEDLAQQSADSWLALVDSGKYADSWNEAASLFKGTVTQEQWQRMIHATRAPLGKVISRNFKTATYTRTLPGVPDGDYVVIQYSTSFEHKQSAIETVTLMLDKDGKWRVSGYYIK